MRPASTRWELERATPRRCGSPVRTPPRLPGALTPTQGKLRSSAPNDAPLRNAASMGGRPSEGDALSYSRQAFLRTCASKRQRISRFNRGEHEGKTEGEARDSLKVSRDERCGICGHLFPWLQGTMRHTGSWKLWTWVTTFLLPACTCLTVRDKPETTCPTLRTERYQDDRNKSELSGFDLGESFALRHAFCEGDKTCFKLGSVLLIRDTVKIFPKGLPEEYAIAVMFRVRRSTKKERWFLWKILNQQNMAQISVVIDGTKKVVEFMFRGAEGDLLNYVFKNRELRPLFDRQWHKLGIGVQSRVLSLYMDCNLIASRHTEEKNSVDFQGRTIIAARASDGKPVDIELHQLRIYCNANFLAEESCCNLSPTKCPEQDDFGSTTSSWGTSNTGKMSSYLPGKQELKDTCQCIPNKEEAGLPGTLRSIGHKGDKGEPGEHGLDGTPGLPGQKGEQGLEGIKGEIGEKGEPGAKGDSGLDGLNGQDGLKGDSGPQGPPGPKGDKGDMGPPGPPALTGSIGIQGPQGPPGKEGQRGRVKLRK